MNCNNIVFECDTCDLYGQWSIFLAEHAGFEDGSLKPSDCFIHVPPCISAHLCQSVCTLQMSLTWPLINTIVDFWILWMISLRDDWFWCCCRLTRPDLWPHHRNGIWPPLNLFDPHPLASWTCALIYASGYHQWVLNTTGGPLLMNIFLLHDGWWM